MADLPPSSESNGDTHDETGIEPGGVGPPRTPRWVKVSGIVVLVLILVVVALLLFGPDTFGPGQHGPGRHMPGSGGGQSPPAQQP